MESFIGWLVPIIVGIPVAVKLHNRKRTGSGVSLFFQSLALSIGLGVGLTFVASFANTVCIEIFHMCKNHGDGNMGYWFNSILLIPIYLAVIIKGMPSAENE